MRINHLKKPLFTVAITLSTASFYFAQQVKDTITKEKAIDQVVIAGVADIAKDRKTPVAVSTIKEAQIVEKLGNQEFPEILNTTPSVYATKGGGGFGDSKLNIRGFDQRNIAVMINGVPINDMESGAVYWSNWSGLSDVTSAMQVQRGLGSSKLAIASVGGTVNVVTRAADKKEGAVVSASVGNNGYLKSLFAYNTGKGEKGWATSFLMSRTAGSTYADGTKFEGYNYYFALGYQKPDSKHDFQFTMTGAPQWHNQRGSYSSIYNYIKYNGSNGTSTDPNRRYNPDWGYLNGEEYAIRSNYYHKPVLSLNWDWKISEKSKLNTVVYASFGRGGGTGSTSSNNTAGAGLSQGTRPLSSFINPSGIIDFNALVTSNAASTPDKGVLIQNLAINSHNWYGMISSFNHKVNQNINFTFGFDGRYYYGYHYQTIANLLGGSAYRDGNNKNLWAPNANGILAPGYNYISNTYKVAPNWNPFGGKPDPISDKIGFNNDGEVLWGGAFGQLEYSKKNLSAFLQGSISEQGFQRIDHFIIDGKSLLNGDVAGYPKTAGGALVQATDTNPVLYKKTGFKYLFGYNVKAGANYNIDAHHNVFANIGYYSKQPILNSVYPNNKNYLNPNLTNEKIFGIEAGYGFRSGWFNANLNLYRTEWKDRFQRINNLTATRADGTTTTTAYANINGITEVHQGFEIDANAKLNSFLTLTGAFSLGDWKYKGTASGNVFDETNQAISGQSQKTLYLDGVRVGNAAQTTASAGFVLEPIKNFKLDAAYRYVDKLYANLNVSNFSTKTAQEYGALRLPHYSLFDLGASYKINLNPKQYFTLRGNVYNLFDKTYIAESNTNTPSNLTQAEYIALGNNANNYASYVQQGNWNGISQTNQVYFGFGRTWTATLAFNF